MKLIIFTYLRLLEYKVTLFLNFLVLYYASCFEYKVCDNIGSFVQFENKPFNFCVDECSRRQRCKILMFRTRMSYCALKEEINITSLQDGEPSCAYYTREEWLLGDLGPCRGQPCNVTERCYSKTETEYECVKSECTAPEQIQNARSLSNMYNIGSTNRYKCSNGFIGQGNPTIKCSDDATWSTTVFGCVLPNMVCPEPKQSYFNADISMVTQNGLFGIVTYTCRNGYRKNGDEVNITCTSERVWDVDRINCCHDNSTQFLRQTCVTLVDGGIVSSRQEAKNYCRSLGGALQWVYYDFVFDTAKTMLILQSATMSYIDSTDWFEKCLTGNNVVYDPGLTLEEKINKIRTDQLTGKDCNWAYNWVPGQPDFNQDDNCIFRDMGDANKRHHDGNCQFSPNVGFACRFHTPEV